MQTLWYGLGLILGTFYMVMPWCAWNHIKDKSWIMRFSTKRFGEKAARLIYSSMGLVLFVVTLFALLNKS